MQGGRWPCLPAFLLVLALIGLPQTMHCREKRVKSREMTGVATAVEPTRVTVLGTKGQELTLVTDEDFTMRVAVGSEVTAWYSPKDGVNHLDWLEFPLENLFVPADRIRSGVKKVIILPSCNVPEGEEIIERIAKYLKANMGWYLAPSALAEEIRRRSRGLNSTLDAVDPATGQFDMSRYLQSERRFMGSLATQARVDAVLEIHVEQVMAKFYDQVAEWDGVVEPVATRMTRLTAGLLPVPINGDVPASTVDMKLWSQQGGLLWSNRRGFAVMALRTGVGNNFRDRSLTEVYQNTAIVQAWIAEALAALVPPKREPSAPGPAPAKNAVQPAVKDLSPSIQ